MRFGSSLRTEANRLVARTLTLQIPQRRIYVDRHLIVGPVCCHWRELA